MESRRAQDQDGGVDERRAQQRKVGVPRREPDRLHAPDVVAPVVARLHDGGVQVQVVRHDRRAQNAEREVEGVGIVDDFPPRHEPAEHAQPVRPRDHDLVEKTARDQHDQPADERLQVAEPPVLQQEDHQHVRRREEDTHDQRQAEKQVERDGRADDLRQVARHDGNLAQHPQHDTDPARVTFAAGLREVVPGDDAQLQREVLQEHGHDVGQHDDRQQPVAELRAAREVCCPVAGVHVADRHEQSRPEERQEAPPARRAFLRQPHGGERLGKGGFAGCGGIHGSKQS